MKSKKQQRADAEYEYYEKDSRAYRWGVISMKVRKLCELLKDYSRNYCDCQICRHSNYTVDYLTRYGQYPPEYEGSCVRCREERQQMKELLDELSKLEASTQEIRARYDGERVPRPLHLP